MLAGYPDILLQVLAELRGAFLDGADNREQMVENARAMADAGAHIAVAMLTDRLPANLRAACRWLVHLLMLVVSLFMIVYGTKLCLETMGQTITSLPWMPVGATYAPVPIGGLLTLFFVLENLVFGTQHDRAVVVFDHVNDTAEA